MSPSPSTLWFHALGANGRLPELPATRTHELLSILRLRLHSGDIDQGGRPARSQTRLVGLFQAFPKSTRHLPNAWIPHDVFVVAAHRENLHTTQCESAPAQIVLEWVEHGV